MKRARTSSIVNRPTQGQRKGRTEKVGHRGEKKQEKGEEILFAVGPGHPTLQTVWGGGLEELGKGKTKGTSTESRQSALPNRVLVLKGGATNQWTHARSNAVGRLRNS